MFNYTLASTKQYISSYTISGEDYTIPSLEDPYGSFNLENLSVAASTILYTRHLLEIPQIAVRYTGLLIPYYALHRACEHGLVDAVSRLIESGCETNEKDDKIATPLYYACYKGHTAIVKRLL